MTYTLAGRLASGGFLDYLVGRRESLQKLRALLHVLSRTYAEGADEIVAETLMAKKRLGQEGISETMLHIMQGICRIEIPEELRACVRYSEMVASYVTARGGGMSHEEALDALSRFFRGGRIG